MKYQDTLAAYGLSEDNLSRPIKKRIKDLTEFQQESDKLTEKINSPTASADFKKTASKTLEEVQIDMAELDAEIAKLIERSVANKDSNQAKAAMLRDKKAAKKLAQQGAASSEPPAAEPPTPAAVIEEPPVPAAEPAPPAIDAPPAAAAATETVVDTPPPTPPAPAAEPAPAAATATEKKEGSLGWGWLVGGVVVLVGAFLGIRAINKNS